MEINIDKMKNLINFFDTEVIPGLKAENENALDHLRKIAEKRREEWELIKAERQTEDLQIKIEDILRNAVGHKPSSTSSWQKRSAVSIRDLNDLILNAELDLELELRKGNFDRLPPGADRLSLGSRIFSNRNFESAVYIMSQNEESQHLEEVLTV